MLGHQGSGWQCKIIHCQAHVRTGAGFRALLESLLRIRIEVGWIDKPIGENVDFLLENLLWGLALTNNCLNPFLAWHLHFHGIVMAGERSASLTNFISNRKHGSTTSEAITLKGWCWIWRLRFPWQLFKNPIDLWPLYTFSQKDEDTWHVLWFILWILLQNNSIK